MQLCENLRNDTCIQLYCNYIVDYVLCSTGILCRPIFQCLISASISVSRIVEKEGKCFSLELKNTKL